MNTNKKRETISRLSHLTEAAERLMASVRKTKNDSPETFWKEAIKLQLEMVTAAIDTFGLRKIGSYCIICDEHSDEPIFNPYVPMKKLQEKNALSLIDNTDNGFDLNCFGITNFSDVGGELISGLMNKFFFCYQQGNKEFVKITMEGDMHPTTKISMTATSVNLDALIVTADIGHDVFYTIDEQLQHWFKKAEQRMETIKIINSIRIINNCTLLNTDDSRQERDRMIFA